MDGIRLSRRAVAERVAQHQLAVRDYRYLRLPERFVLLLPVVVDVAAGAAPLPALELGGDGRQRDCGVGVFEPGQSGVVSEWQKPRCEGPEEGFARDVGGAICAWGNRGSGV